YPAGLLTPHPPDRVAVGPLLLPSGEGSLLAELAGQRSVAVDLLKGLGDGDGGDGDRAVEGGVVGEVAGDAVDVVVERGADQLAAGVDHRRTGAAAGDVVGGGEVEHRGGVEPGNPAAGPAARQPIRRRAGGVLEEAGEGG